MFDKKRALMEPARPRDPFAVLRQMLSSMERAFDEWPASPGTNRVEAWAPKIDVMERDSRLITRFDLPGVKKDDVDVEVMDGQLIVSGERKRESEETKGSVYRSEREYGSFYRAVPLPEGCKAEDVRATFVNGVLEVSVPLAAPPQPAARKVAIEEPVAVSKSAA